MQEIIILNGKTNLNALSLAKEENKPVLVCWEYSDYGMLVYPNETKVLEFKLSNVILVDLSETGYGGCQHRLTSKKIPQERRNGYVL